MTSQEKKMAKSAAAKPKNVKTKPSHPSFKEMIKDAIIQLVSNFPKEF